MHLRLPATIFGLCTFALVAGPAFAQSEPGNQLQLTNTIEVQMGGTSMPARTTTKQECVSAKKPDPRKILKDQKECTIDNYRQLGDTVSYRVTCSGEMTMVSDATFHFQADGGMHGTVHGEGNVEGRKMLTDMTIDGKRIGSCQYTPKEG
jgi:hypothetical protein